MISLVFQFPWAKNTIVNPISLKGTPLLVSTSAKKKSANPTLPNGEMKMFQITSRS